jgi:hypothetical protein
MSEIDALGHRFFGDSYWQGSRLFAAPVIFLHTKAQVDSHGGSPILGQLDDAYRDLVAAQDEFGYFDRSATFVPLDSRENFEANYGSNWCYYWK